MDQYDANILLVEYESFQRTAEEASLRKREQPIQEQESSPRVCQRHYAK